MNMQPVEKRVTAFGDLSVHSIFSTIQGEGPNAGRPAIFIRLAGCNLQCPLCDTDYTTGRQMMPVIAIAEEVVKLGTPGIKLIVITGGEPFRQDLDSLIATLLSMGYKVQIETNGTLPWPNAEKDIVEIVCSPKTPTIAKQLVPYITAYKYVISAGNMAKDGIPIEALGLSLERYLFRPPEGFPIEKVYIQPEDSKHSHQNEQNLGQAICSCMKNGYTLCIQVHKTINLP